MFPALIIVVPGYNEESVLPITAPLFLEKIISLIEYKKINEHLPAFAILQNVERVK